MTKNKGGRPTKYTQERISEIIKEMDKYTQDAMCRLPTLTLSGIVL